MQLLRRIEEHEHAQMRWQARLAAEMRRVELLQNSNLDAIHAHQEPQHASQQEPQRGVSGSNTSAGGGGGGEGEGAAGTGERDATQTARASATEMPTSAADEREDGDTVAGGGGAGAAVPRRELDTEGFSSEFGSETSREFAAFRRAVREDVRAALLAQQAREQAAALAQVKCCRGLRTYTRMRM